MTEQKSMEHAFALETLRTRGPDRTEVQVQKGSRGREPGHTSLGRGKGSGQNTAKLGFEREMVRWLSFILLKQAQCPAWNQTWGLNSRP